MINIVIIEDEKLAYENLKHLVLRFAAEAHIELNIIHWLTSIEQSKAWFNSNSMPDLLFLDIQLQDGQSFAIFNESDIHCPIIFTTAFDQYALKAFELNSVDYLLKPLSFDKVAKGLNKFLKNHQSSQDNSHLQSQYQQLVQELSRLKNPKKLLAKSGNDFVSLPTNNILYLYSDESTFCVADNGRTYSIKGTLAQIESELDNDSFFRVNRKIVINRSAIVNAKTGLGGKVNINLQHMPEFSVHVSRERAKVFKQWFGS